MLARESKFLAPSAVPGLGGAVLSSFSGGKTLAALRRLDDRRRPAPRGERSRPRGERDARLLLSTGAGDGARSGGARVAERWRSERGPLCKRHQNPERSWAILSDPGRTRSCDPRVDPGILSWDYRPKKGSGWGSAQDCSGCQDRQPSFCLASIGSFRSLLLLLVRGYAAACCCFMP